MTTEASKSKIITVSLPLHDVQSDPFFMDVPDAVKDEKTLKNTVLNKYQTQTGILEGFVDANRIILQWYPEDVNPSAEALHAEALQLAKAKSFRDAIVKWEKASSLNPEDVDYVYKLGLVYYELKKYHDSLRYVENAVKLCPIHYRAHLLAGINWIKLRKFDRAEQHLVESRRLNKNNLLIYLNLGAIYSIQKRHNEAIDMFNTVIGFAPKESRAYLGLARLYSMLDDVEASNSYFKKVIELSPGSRLADYAKRSIQIIEEESISETGSDNGQREELFAKGVGYYIQGEYHQSAKQYKDYLKNQPSDDYGWYLMGEVKLRTGETEEAADCFKRAIRLNGKRGLYYKLLGVSLHFLGRSKDVLEVFKKATDMGKKDALTWTIQGINLMRQRKFDEAIQNLNASMKKNPNNPLGMYHLALSYVQTKEKDKALDIARRILLFEFFVPLKVQAKKLIQNLQTSS